MAKVIVCLFLLLRHYWQVYFAVKCRKGESHESIKCVIFFPYTIISKIISNRYHYCPVKVD